MSRSRISASGGIAFVVIAEIGAERSGARPGAGRDDDAVSGERRAEVGAVT